MKTFDKIILATQQIQNISSRIEHCRLVAACTIKEKEEPFIFEHMVHNNESQLQSILDALMEIVENSANYINSTDNICGEDIALYKVPFDILYNRVSEDDYESINVEYTKYEEEV